MRFASLILASSFLIGLAPTGHAQQAPGITKTEIKLGQTVAYSGPASAYGVLGRMHLAYYKMINERGGINGRKINLISVDDAYSPPKAVEMTRKLVESDQVFAMLGSMSTAGQVAVQKYLNGKQVPQVLIYASSPVLHDPQNSPWTVPFSFAYEIEGEIYGKHLRVTKPEAKIAVLYQNDDVGRSYVKGLKKGLGALAGQIVKETTTEISDPTVDSQILQLSATNADVFVSFVTNKAQIQALRKVASTGWKPLYIVPYISSSISAVLANAGAESATGVLSAYWFKSPSDPEWANDKAVADYLAFMKKYLPDENPLDTTPVFSYMNAQLSVLALQRCGDNLTRENFLKQIVNLRDAELAMLLPGMKVEYRPDSYFPIRQARIARFDGTTWKPVTSLITIDK